MFTEKPVQNGSNSRPATHEEFVEIFTERQPEDNSADRDRSYARGGYLAELEEWLEEAVFGQIKAAIVTRDSKELHKAFNEATLQIKRRVLASYHNGLKARKNG